MNTMCRVSLMPATLWEEGVNYGLHVFIMDSTYPDDD